MHLGDLAISNSLFCEAFNIIFAMNMLHFFFFHKRFFMFYPCSICCYKLQKTRYWPLSSCSQWDLGEEICIYLELDDNFCIFRCTWCMFAIYCQFQIWFSGYDWNRPLWNYMFCVSVILCSFYLWNGIMEFHYHWIRLNLHLNWRYINIVWFLLL